MTSFKSTGIAVARFVLAIMCVVLVSQRLQAETLPNEINNQAFWRMVTDFSEPGQSFTDNNSDNVLSNEAMYQSVIPALIGTTRPGGAYIGVGPEQNFTYMA